MKTFFRSKYLLIGVLAGLLISGGWFAWAAIQSQVGVNTYDSISGSWYPSANRVVTPGADNETSFTSITSSQVPDIDSILHAFNGTGYDRLRTVGIGDAVAQTGILAQSNFLFNGATYDRLRSSAIGDGVTALGIQAIGLFGFNGTTYDRLRTTTLTDTLANPSPGTLGVGSFSLIWNPGTSQWNRRITGTDGTSISGASGNFQGLPGSLNYIRAPTGAFPIASASGGGDGGVGNSVVLTSPNYFNGATFDRSRAISGTNLSATTSTGAQITVPLSTWVTSSGPTAGAQATASKAAGGGTVRHVTTSISACYSDSAASAVARHINLRDGATGAGTIIARWMLAVTAVDNNECVTLSGLAIIGTANTAMTLEFDAAGAATGEQTVTLTGFSVP